MKKPTEQSTAHGRILEASDHADCVLNWIDGLVETGMAAFDDSTDEFPILHLRSGEVFLLGDSSITRVR